MIRAFAYLLAALAGGLAVLAVLLGGDAGFCWAAFAASAGCLLLAEAPTLLSALRPLLPA